MVGVIFSLTFIKGAILLWDLALLLELVLAIFCPNPRGKSILVLTVGFGLLGRGGLLDCRPVGLGVGWLDSVDNG